MRKIKIHNSREDDREQREACSTTSGFYRSSSFSLTFSMEIRLVTIETSQSNKEH